ncbi:MAG: adenylate/guanylate cyclase domain-containing protein [Nostocaceae cyanobacterium]|nr:adenylate/guanylate cyclase domain-containing protein [Nostocaceae cyanobacterium]
MRLLITRILDALSQLLFRRTILILTLLFCVGLAGALWNISRLSSELVKTQALETTALYAQAIKEARTLYASKAVDKVKMVPGISVTHDYATKEGAIPLPATYLIELASSLSKQNTGMSVRLYSDYPFPWRKTEGGATDNFEKDALSYLRQNPQQPYYSFENFQGRLSLRYAQADLLKPSCVNCHNTHPDSPKRDWKVGDVRGILEITTPLDSYMVKTFKGLKGTFMTLAIVTVLALSGLALVISKQRRTSVELERRVRERTAQLQLEQEKSERLLLNILPEPIAIQLKQQQRHIADGFTEVTILFADIVGFTQLSEQLPPEKLVKLLNELFTAFDWLCEKHNLEKIKTIGDAYMVASGLPHMRQDHAEAMAEMALDIQQEVRKFSTKNNLTLNVRIGINTGPVVAGVIGTKKFIYDLWGDAVNTASRMESQGIPGSIQVTESTYERLKDKYVLEKRGVIQVKGKGDMTTYLLLARKVCSLIQS